MRPPWSASATRDSAVSALNLITLRMRGHAGPSGYHRLSEGMDARLISVGPSVGRVAQTLTKPYRHLVRQSGSSWYQLNCLWGEARAAARWTLRDRQIFHFLYGENLFRNLGGMRARSRHKQAIVATYHTPTWRMRELVTDTDHLKHLQAVVVMANCQKAYFEEVAPQASTHFVPHGIDTDYFHPQQAECDTDRFRLICVGFHLRDFEVVAAVAKAVHASHPHIEFTVVCSPDRSEPLRGLDNVRLLSGISDEELRQAYQDSDALFLPLLDATANNALLEGMLGDAG